MDEENNDKIIIKNKKIDFKFSIHACRLFKAISNVNKDFLIYSKPVDINKRCKKDEKKAIREQLERIFAYELYHQWTLLLSKTDGLILNGEVQKNIKRSKKYPDLVLHGGQGNPDQNEIVVEIKRGRHIKNKNIVEDLEKLSIFLIKDKRRMYANYHDAVFIFIGGNMDIIYNAISKDKIWTRINNNIICVTYNYDYSDKTYTLELARVSDLCDILNTHDDQLIEETIYLENQRYE